MLQNCLSKIIHADWPSWYLAAKGLVVLFLIYNVASTIVQYFRLRHIKGPFVAGFSKWWFLRAIMGGQSHLETTAVNKRYGPVARITPDDVVISDYDRIKQVMAVGSRYTRSNWYKGFRIHPVRDHVLSTVNDVQHTAYRSKLAAGYSGRDVQDLESKMDEVISSFIAFLDRRVASQERFDLAYKVSYFTVDMISQLAFGSAFGFLESDTDLNGYVQSTQSYLPILALSTVVETIMSIRLSRFFAALFPMERMVPSQYKLMKIAEKVAAERFGPDRKVQQDMIGSFIEHGLDQEQLEVELPLTLLAGSETTSTSIRTSILYIISNPTVLARLRSEIDTAAVESTAQLMPDATLSKLPYLHAILQESLRITPPGTGYFARRVPPEGADLMGVFLPAGTKVNINIWGVTRQESIWGDDADEFRPERWLQAEPEKLKEMVAAVEMVFSHGKSACLGRALALKSVRKAIVELLRRFDFTLCYPMQPMKSRSCLTFAQSDLWVRVQRRAGT